MDANEATVPEQPSRRLIQPAAGSSFFLKSVGLESGSAHGRPPLTR